LNIHNIFAFRNRLAQRANRASVVLNAQYLLDNKPAETDGFVTQLKDNGVSVVAPKYGVETIVEFPPNCTVKLNLFQKVKVKLAVVEKNQRRMLNMEIIEPKISAESAEVEASEMPLA
jgi:exoribonuclease R